MVNQSFSSLDLGAQECGDGEGSNGHHSEKVRFQRSLIIALPKGQSAFLWGPRKTGKTTLLKQLFPKSIYYNLLKTDTLFRLSKEPHLLREELLSKSKSELSKPIIIDEIQKVPPLLDSGLWSR